MTIYQKGWADQLVPSLVGLSENIPRMLNPKFDIQQQLKAAIAKNPDEVLQQLADLGPDTVEKIYGKEMLPLIAGRQKSAKKQVGDYQAKVVQTLTQDASAPPVPMVMPVNALGAGPIIQTPTPRSTLAKTMLEGATEKSLGITPSQDVEQKGYQNIIFGNKAAASGTVEQGNIAQALDAVDSRVDKQKADTTVAIVNKRLAGTGKTFTEALMDEKSPFITPDERAAIFKSPETVKALTLMLDTDYRKNMIDIQRQELGISRQRLGIEQQNANTAAERLKIDRADASMSNALTRAVWLSTGGGVDPQVLRDVINDPSIAESPTATPAQKQAAEAVKRYQSNRTTEATQEIVSSYNKTIKPQLDIIYNKKSSPEQRKQAAANIQSITNMQFKDYLGAKPSIKFIPGVGLREQLTGGQFWTPSRDDKVIIDGDPTLVGLITAENPDIQVAPHAAPTKFKIDDKIAQQWKSATPQLRKESLDKITDPTMKANLIQWLNDNKLAIQ